MKEKAVFASRLLLACLLSPIAMQGQTARPAQCGGSPVTCDANSYRPAQSRPGGREPKTRYPKHEVDLLSNPTGEKVLGPRTIVFKHVNRIKYDLSIGTQTTPIAGIKPDLAF